MSDDGLVNLNKPAGMTSFAVVAAVRRLTRIRKVGHGGTLDPDASGVLPIGLGQGTRIFAYVEGSTKVYRAEIVLGSTTDTYDASGTVVAESDPAAVTQEQVEAALTAFRGHILQRPPMYSALKREGQRLYELARQGVQLDLEPRPVHIVRLDLVEWHPPALRLDIECGRGTYIRSLAHDLGQALGCGAHLRTLVRTRDGSFTLDRAVTLDAFAAAAAAGCWRDLLLPLDAGLPNWPAVTLDPEQVRLTQTGRLLSLDPATMQPAPALSEGERCRAYAPDGTLLAVLGYRAEDGLWHPDKVFVNSAGGEVNATP